MDRYILLSPGGGWRSKCWPPDRFGDLSRQIRDTLGLRCVINYGPGEEALAESIKVASRSADPVAYSGTLEKLMALARNALCVVGGDTGPLHLAVAVGTPSVSIYGPTDPARNGPFPNPAPAFVEARHVAPSLPRRKPVHPILRPYAPRRNSRRTPATRIPMPRKPPTAT